jgi:ATP-binding cassette subfamily B (MDR/TAP) protein 1
MRVGIIKGFKVGLGNGLLFGTCFLTYALGFWYGAKLVTQSRHHHDCTIVSNSGGCLSGGTILAVFFSIIMGSMALGQVYFSFLIFDISTLNN